MEWRDVVHSYFLPDVSPGPEDHSLLSHGMMFFELPEWLLLLCLARRVPLRGVRQLSDPTVENREEEASRAAE